MLVEELRHIPASNETVQIVVSKVTIISHQKVEIDA